MGETKVTNSVFAQVLEQTKKMKEAEEAKKNSSNYSFEEYEQLSYCTLEDEKETVLRVLGLPFNPITLDRNKSTDPKLVLESSIVKDDKKGYVKIKWPVIVKDGKYVPDPDWILTRLYNKVMEGKWDKYTDGHLNEKGKNGEWKKYHVNTETFKRIEGNAKEGEKYPKNFYPSARIMMNVLDRTDAWCKENKKSKILTSKRSPFEITKEDGTKDTIYFTDTGIPRGLYTKIFDRAIKAVGDWDLDLCVVKKSKDKDYDVWEANNLRVQTGDISEGAFKLAVDTGLTEEELKYELVDIDKIANVASYNKLKKNLIGLFKQCDADLGTRFSDELEILAKEESEKWAKEKEEKEKQNQTQVSKEEPKVVEEKISNMISEAKPRERSKPVEALVENVDSLESQCIKNYPHWNDLSDEDRAIMIKTIDHFEGTIAVFKNEFKDDIYLCTNEQCCYVGTTDKTQFHENVMKCAVCGASV